MPPSARSHKGSSPRRKALHPYQRPLPSALAAQPAASDTEQKSLNKQDKQHVSDASIHLSAPETSSLQGSGRRKKKNKRKKNKNTRAMQSDAIKSSYAPPASPLSPSRPLLNKYGTQVTPPISQSGISEVAILPTKHNTDLATSQPSSNAGPVNDKARAANLDRDIIRLREEARKREAIHIELYKAQEEAGRLREKVENLTKHEDELKARVEELQRIVEVNNKKTEILDTAMQQHNSTKKDLTEVLTCTVCFEVLKDPYMLSCGHMACKSCLFNWFRSPGAYRRPPTTITSTSNLSYYTKICHMCRCIIVRRPTRVFFLRSILEPLGLHQDNPSPPVASHPSELPSSTASDPWELIFPPDPTTYKLHDDADHCLRCPECMGEIEDGNCTTCGNNFSSDSEMEGQSDENFDNFDWLYDEEDESSEEFFAQRFFDFPLAPIYNQRHPLGRGSGDDQSNSGSDSSSQEDGLPDHVGIGNLSVDTDVVTDSEGYEDSFIDDEEEESWSGDNSGDSDVVPLEDEDRPTRGGPPPRVRSVMSESGDESDQPVFTGRTRRMAGRVVSDSE
ncbi:hypothetical protein AYX14_02179 [Cryptococcus neoformans]|nr:hypothetical protein AYX15_01017 [Cryptococcus neoformans var. grubii]OWZ72329.1 hypothetical protein AYX14_02179 [Cryptococcus neoformans var. grubii]